jgi:hypothetical protein
MDGEILCEESAKKHPNPRKFRFVDQNDRSREAATVYQSVVRSHVMTEIRREKRSKFKINETGGETQSIFEVCRDEEIQETQEVTNKTTRESPNYSSPSRQERTNNLSHVSQKDIPSIEPCTAHFDAGDEWDSTAAFGDRIEAFQSRFEMQEVFNIIDPPD